MSNRSISSTATTTRPTCWHTCWRKPRGVLPLSTVHGWTGHSAKERYIYYPADQRVLARFPRLVAVSGEIKSVLVAKGADPKRVSVVLERHRHRRLRSRSRA